MEALLFVFYSLVLVGVIYWWSFFELRDIARWKIIAVFILKILFGFAMAEIYTDHYTDRKTGDTFRFYDDAKIMTSAMAEDPGTYIRLFLKTDLDDPEVEKYYLRMTHFERKYSSGFINDNATVIRANSILMLFSRGYYSIHILFWCFLSMIGLTGLLRLLIQYFPRKKRAMFFSVYLLPTVLFWGSGVLKEPFLLLGLGLFLPAFYKYLYDEFKLKHLLPLVFGIIILLLVKGYVVQCMAPALIGLLLVKFFRGKRFWLWFSIPHIAILVLIFLGPYISDELKVAEMMSLKQEAFYNIAEMSESGSVMEIPPIESSFDILTNAPGAVVRTYFRPWPWEWDKITYIPAALENLVLILLILIMIWNFRRPYGLNIPIVAFALSFVLTLGILTGEVVPILGAVVRYKAPALIFLFVLVFALTDHIKFQRRMPFFKRIIRKL